MKYLRLTILSTALFAILATGCASGKASPTTLPTNPGDLQNANLQDSAPRPNRLILGLWDINISADHQTVEVVPARSTEMHLNVVRLLEVTPCKTCLTIANVKIVEPNVLEADLTLTHPYPGLIKYTGFDLRGIFISQGNFTFPVSGRNVAYGTDVPMVLNADGYTPLFNPTEFPENQPGPPALRYIPGKKATGGDLSATLNPFIAFRRDAPRRMFEAGGSETRTVRLYAPPGPIHFGYAVDACWQSVENVIDPLTDFPPDANCLEAYAISVDLPSQVGSATGNQAPVYVEVSDHQGLDSIASVRIEAPDLFAGEIGLTCSAQTGEESWLFEGTVTNETGVGHGAYPLLVRVGDTESDQNLGQIDAWQVVTAGVNRGWARTWGGSDFDPGRGVTVDGLGNVYVTGRFWSTVDFDPGPGTDNHTSNGMWDAYLTKFDSSGVFQWAKTWGGNDWDQGSDVAADASGDVYVTGWFGDTVDFDPGAGADIHTCNGILDAYLSKFDSSGTFLWAKTWGGSGEDLSRSVATDGSGNTFVTGWFGDTVDFDPGAGVDNHTSNGSGDPYLTKFDSSGTFQWANTWGGSNVDMCWGAAVDGSGNVYVTGSFQLTADFDPGSGVENHVSNGNHDAFLGKFDSSGAFQWANTWGGSSFDECRGAAVDGSGNVCVAGRFSGTVDLDPGSGVDNHTSSGSDAFLSKFDSSGAFQWANTWGPIGWDVGPGAATDGSGNVYATGGFEETVDFDPGSGVENHTSNGSADAFLSKFDSSGAFQWVNTWGEGYGDYDDAVAVDGSANVYAVGYFCSMVDFDPGSGFDNHTSNGLADAFLVKFLPDGTW